MKGFIVDRPHPVFVRGVLLKLLSAFHPIISAYA